MKQNYALSVLGIFSLLLIFNGCGYFVSSNPSISTDKHNKLIYLEVFQNFTHPYKPGLDILLFKSLSQELIQSAYELTTDENKADYVISGQIVDYKQTVLSTAPDQTPTEIQVSIKIKLKITDKSGREKNFVVQHKPEPFAVVLGEKLEDAEKRGLRNASEQIILILAGAADIN